MGLALGVLLVSIGIWTGAAGKPWIAAGLLLPAGQMLWTRSRKLKSGNPESTSAGQQSKELVPVEHPRLVQAFRQAGISAWECDPKTGLFRSDDDLRVLFETTEYPGPVPREVWRERVHPDDREPSDRRWKAALADGPVYENEYRVVRSSGAVRVYRTVASITRNAAGEATLVTGMTWDVTEEREQQRAFMQRQERFERTLEAIADGVIAVDTNQSVVYVNPVAARMLALPRAECLGRPLTNIFFTEHELTGQSRGNPVERCRANGGSPITEDGILVGHSGARYNIRKHVTLLEDGGGVITFHDITGDRLSAKALQYAATHDPLTGLPNRVAFEAHLGKVWKNERQPGRTHSLCLLDLDRFKIINDISGHIAGDALLRQVVHLLKAQVPEGDMLARIGGDEFLVLLSDTDLDQAQAWARDVMSAIEKMRFAWEGKNYAVTVSAGLVQFDSETPSSDTLISEADVAMYSSKCNGRNQAAVFQEDGGAALREMETLTQLRSALEEDRFELHAQPIVSVCSTEEKSYFELLVRMRDTSGALVQPNLFIPAAEKFGMMRELDRWVIRNALQVYSGHPSLGNLRFAINLSGQSLSDVGLWAFVRAVFQKTGVPPETITFEVTETSIIDNITVATTFLQEVRQLGCRVALDDFGTGMSSLSYLKQFAMDYLKIDGSFIKQLGDSPLDQSIVRATSEIARTMQVITVGECAEDMRTVELLQELGVNLVQGWATGHPQLLQEVLCEHAANQEFAPVPAAMQKDYAALSFGKALAAVFA